MKDVYIVPASRHRANRFERALVLLRLWYARSDLLRAILAIKDAPSKLKHPLRWLDLTSRMLRPFTCVAWTVDQKVARIVDHHKAASRLGGIVAPKWEAPRKLMDLPVMGPDYSVKIDEAYWMTGDGLTTISVWRGVDRMFTMGFVLSQEGGRLSAYVGGLQGRGVADILPVYREMTKDAKGIRPRDLMIELHRMFCRAIGVTQIYAVTEMARSWNDRFADEELTYIASVNYDDAWTERGGKRNCSNWFTMPVEAQRRDIEDIPSRKRGLYRQRYEMLDTIEREMAAAVSRLVPGRVSPPVRQVPIAATSALPAGYKTKAALLVLAATTVAWLAE